MGPLPLQEEHNIGLEVFFTDTEPLGGRLRKDPEDFVVKEISEPPVEVLEGDFSIATVTVRNWETNRLVQALADSIGMSKKAIKFAGTKDKRAITSQLMSFKCPPERLLQVKLRDLRISNIYRSSTDLVLGGLYGNDFHIKIRDISIDQERVRSLTERCLGKMVSIGGFPNFFGVQRFGAVRPITHLVGKQIVKRQFKEAVLTYICEPYQKEPAKQQEKRRQLEKNLDFENALAFYPMDAIFERSMISHLSKNPDDWTGALEILPENLKMMFVHAYQSYLFNRMLSERIRRGISLNEPVEGDMLLPLNKKRLPDRHTYIEVRKDNIDEMQRLVKDGRAFISGLIIGRDPIYAKGEMGEIERSIISSEDLIAEDFDIFEIEKISSNGIRREILAPVFDLKWRVQSDKETVMDNMPIERTMLELKFTLFRGSYATSFLRELIKGPLIVY
ncbi:MAG: tRNA pseudouridine(13) synthase TruD [Candidatus Thermoplasmatota archaeon]|nr:tRNA pseudouridine(13) synthase TruD [Candidatus Thermoplasmatota archaeon]